MMGFCSVVLCLMCPLQDAEAQSKGFLYAHQHIDSEIIKEKHFAAADVFVYTPDGTIVHSGKGTGSFGAAELITLEPGDYLVEVGRYRTRHNLQRYKVVANQVTVIETGWVSVTTWDWKDQPDGPGCTKWNSGLRAMRLVNGKEFLINSNTDLKPGSSSMIQLPIGTYRVYFNGLATNVTIKADTIYQLPVGVAGPFSTIKARLSSNKAEGVGVPSVGICDDFNSHIIAGDWWLLSTTKIEEYPYEKKSWEKLSISATSGGKFLNLKPDSLRSGVYRGAGSKPEFLSPKQLVALDGYKEGALTKSIGGKFKGTSLENLFEDTTDVQLFK